MRGFFDYIFFKPKKVKKKIKKLSISKYVVGQDFGK
jgi:hypothetical protein